jgi:drug/metabolite transporter (DMT)-like permease
LSDGKAAPHVWRIYAIAGIATLIWSVNYIVVKHALREFPPMLVSSLRTAMAALLMIPVYIWHTREREQPQFTPRDLWGVMTLGVIGVGLNQVLFVLGISLTTVGHAGIVVGLTPVQVLLLAALFGHERIKPLQLAGMLIALLGVAVLQLSSAANVRGSSLTGDLLVFCGCLFFAVLIVCGKSQSARLGPITFSTWGYLASATALLPVTFWYSTRFSYENVTWTGWASLFYMAAGSSVIGYLLFYYALTHIAASRISTFAYLQPVIAMVLAMIFLGERPGASLVSGAALVLAGVFVAERA